MDRLREPRRRVPLGVLILGALALASIGLVALVQFGPPLPGPQVAESLGIRGSEFVACSPEDSEFRLPSEPPPAPGKWRGEPSLPESYDELQAAAVGGQVFVGTGQFSNEDRELESVDQVFAFDPRAGRWAPLTTTPEPLNHSSFATYHGDLYVVGGFSGGGTSNGLWRYSPDDRRWTELEGMQHARGAHEAAVIGDRLYVVGGLFENNPETSPTKTMEVYDFRTGEWSEGPEMGTERHHLAVAAVGGQLYAIGGRLVGDFSLDTVERFDPESDRWEELAPLPQGSGGLTATAVNGELYAVGGGDDNDEWVTPATWTFNPEEGQWRRQPDVGVPRHGHAAAATNGRIYIFGGAPCEGYGKTDSVESLPTS